VQPDGFVKPSAESRNAYNVRLATQTS